MKRGRANLTGAAPIRLAAAVLAVAGVAAIPGLLGRRGLLAGLLQFGDSSCPTAGKTHMASVPWYGIKRKIRTRWEPSRKRPAWVSKPCAIISGAAFFPSR